MVPELYTQRLLLKPLVLADAVQVQEEFPKWEIVRFLSTSVPWPYPPDGAHTFFKNVSMPAIERGEEWYWTLRLKTDPEKLIGCITLVKGEKDNRGFWLAPPWQKQGLMTEASEVVTDYWFNVLNFSVLRTVKAITNEASRRISEKNGMRVIGTEEREFLAGLLMAEICEVTAAEWNAARRAPR
jgi:[ribosomal protein S5]-alanine N-acetyltransferase